MTDMLPMAQERQDAQVVSEHLPSGYTAEFDGVPPTEPSGPSEPNYGSENSREESSLRLQGGDIHRDLFKLDARVKKHRRANTFHHPALQPLDDEEDAMTVSEQLAPGGFRRAFIQQQNQRADFLAARMPVTRNFVEFLDLYGSFAGEDLHDSDEEAIEEEEEQEADTGGERTARPVETQPLLGRRKSLRYVRSAQASTPKTFFTLLKAFIGTGIMFLPKAFNNGGMLFSSMAMLLVSAITMVAFHLLLRCKEHHSGGYGDIGETIAGKTMRGLILGSIALSQLGFVCTGIVFVAENMTSFLEAVVNGQSPLSTMSLVLLQLIVLIPLAFIRDISKLGPVALLADVFILIGLAYIYYFDIASLATEGLNETVVLFNPEKYTLTIGAAIFTFEGIGLILPIQASMAKPHHFEWLLGVVMLLITVIFTAVGALCYATFGSATKIEVIDNYPQDSKLVNAVQFLYALAVLAGTPVQLFPALRVLEVKIFGKRSGKKSLRTKWVKNAFRALLVVACSAVSIFGAKNLDRFVALIGSFACVPLVYVYPPYLHYRSGLATSWYAKTGDLLFMMLGLVCMVYTTMITVANSFL